MKNLSKVSALAIIAALAASGATGAFAAEVKTDNSVNVTHETKADPEARGAMRDVQNGLANADRNMRETADDIRAFVLGDKPGDDMKPVTISRKTTVEGLLKQDIIGSDGKKIATVKDIVVDKNGKAQYVVVSDGGVLGIGNKLAAFDYGRVVAQQKDGDVVMSLSQDMIDRAKEFSYDADDAGKDKIIPADSVSVNDILDGHILDSRGEKVADIDNLTIENGNAARLVVSFNKTFGLGGDLAALEYGSLKPVVNDGEVNFQLTGEQTESFRAFKKSASN